jgi:cytidylate kinase
MDPVLAEQALRGEDMELAAFIRQLYRREIDDPTGYDMILNLEHLEAEAAADAVVTALRRKLGAPA